MVEVEPERFAVLVSEALDGIPDELGRLMDNVNVFVDGEDAKRGDGLATHVGPGSVVHVINAVSGG